MHLFRVLQEQAALATVESYENELQMMRALAAMPGKSQQICRQLSLEWMNSLNRNLRRNTNPEDIEHMIELSNHFRNEGNVIFKKKIRNVLMAATFYTKAILTAPVGEALALAHANRAAALQEYGYYQAAYDDCVCAKEYNFYPQKLMQKLHARQAFCALKLGNTELLQLHLNVLDGMTLNENIQKHVNELHAQLKHILEKTEKTEQQVQSVPEPNLCNVVISEGSDGRHLVATTTINKDQRIFRERISTLVSLDDFAMCQECAATQIVPFPCTKCGGRVVYCSIKCRRLHAEVHRFECPAFDLNIPANIGIGHLAMRIFLTGLPQLIAEVRELKTADAIWAAVGSNGHVTQNESIEYARTLRMVTHLQQLPYSNIIMFALLARLMVLYLKEYTTIFQLMEQSNASSDQWELIAGLSELSSKFEMDQYLVTGSLLLKHIGQLIVNGHAYMTIVPKPAYGEHTVCSLLNHTVWAGPLKLRCGQLHNFSQVEQVGAVDLPFLSICNHSCIQHIQTTFAGRHVDVLANKQLRQGEQIYNTYISDCRKMSTENRRSSLLSSYHFTCECAQCQKPNPDEEYEQFHRYQCENPACQAIFVPRLPQLPHLQWWRQDIQTEVLIECTACGTAQEFEWYHNFENLIENVNYRSAREMLYCIFDSLNRCLLDYHKFKMYLGLKLVDSCFEFGDDFIEKDFSKLGNIMLFVLQGTEQECGANSLSYAAKLTYLWDLIALKKFKCTHQQMAIMLPALNALSDEFKTIFSNYYECYIEPVLE